MNLSFLWSKFFKKIQGSAVLNSKIHPTSKVEAGSQIVNSSFDKHSFCGYNCQILNSEIGSFCSISNNVVIGGGMHPMNWVSMSPVFYHGKDSVKTKFSEHHRRKPEKIIIGNDVWIGEKVIIKQGVKIGTGSVIGMGSIVTRDILPYSIVVGAPAKEIRKRFDESIINGLLESKWWELEDKKLAEYASYFKDPKLFLEKFNS